MFINSPLRVKEGKNGRLITSHRSTTYSCCLPALGGFSRSWSCKTCRRKDKGIAVFFVGCLKENVVRKKKFYLFFPFVFFAGVVPRIISSFVGRSPSGFVFIQIVLSILIAGFDFSSGFYDYFFVCEIFGYN